MKNTKIIDILLVIIILTLIFSSIIWGFFNTDDNYEKNTENPNIIFITIDTLRADYINEKNSPFLDEFKKQNLYIDMMTNGSWTAPNTATMLTGLHPDTHNIERGKAPHKNFQWLAETLKDNKYNTAAFSANRNVGKKYKMKDGFDYFYEPEKELFSDNDEINFPDISELNNNIINWLDKKYDSNQSLFLYMQPMNVHGPYPAPENIRKQFQDESANSFVYRGEIMRSIVDYGNIENRNLVSEKYLTDLKNQYKASVFYTDQEIHRLIDHLKKNNLYDNSIIIITSDHGEELFDHGGFSHGYSLYQEILNVPFIIKSSNNIIIEKKSDNKYMQQIDVLPSLLGILNIGHPELVDGQNIFNKNYKQKPIISKADWTSRCRAHSIIDWPYKLISTETDYQNRKNYIELFNLEEDPEEQKNLAEEQPDLKQELLNKLIQP